MDYSPPGCSVHGILQALYGQMTGNWSGLLFPPPGDPPDPGTELESPALAGDSLPLSHFGSPYLEDMSS